ATGVNDRRTKGKLLVVELYSGSVIPNNCFQGTILRSKRHSLQTEWKTITRQDKTNIRIKKVDDLKCLI
ncbi:hypothetical protein, partial [Levilactobacillus brevis]|uniref:hypothetical protein n=1 Tax=Levilactobacillus brevis TaxID=1580 RepID=UPI001C01242A